MSVTGYIYSLNCPISGEPKYIGQTIQKPAARLGTHLTAKKNNKRTSWIKGLLNQGLKPVMEVIEELPQEELNFWEIYYISLYKSWGFKLKNGTHGGECGGKPTMETRMKQRAAKLGTKQSEETKKKRAASLIGNKNGLGYRHTPEQRAKIVGNKIKFKHTRESKLKMSIIMKKNNKYTKHKNENPLQILLPLET